VIKDRKGENLVGLLIQIIIIITVISFIVGKKLLNYWKSGKISDKVKNIIEVIDSVITFTGLICFHMYFTKHLKFKDNCGFDALMEVYQYCYPFLISFGIVTRIWYFVLKYKNQNRKRGE